MPRIFPVRILFCALLLVLPLFSAQAQEANPFVRPAGLEPAIKFWQRVYTEVATTGGLVHDHTRMEVVYTVLDFPAGTSAKMRTDRIDDEKAFIVSTLRKLGWGSTDLSAAEQRVRNAWPEGTLPSEFRAGAERVRFQLGQSDRFREGLIRSGAWREEIRRIFRREGLPEQLAALPHVESSFNTYAYSKVGAAGMWQFMRSTGKRYLRIDNIVDERLDPYKASAAAADFLEQNYAVLQSWPLALTAYNHGANGMLRAKEQVGTDDIVKIIERYESKSFGFASRNFYACFLAALEIDSNPEKYFPGIELRPDDPSKVMVLKSYTSAPSLARSMQLETAVLKQLNPSLMAGVWSGSRRIPAGFEFRVPGSVDQLAALRSLPSTAVASTQVADKTHRVRKGETLSAIASRYRVSTQTLARLNGLRQPYRVQIGKVLKLPGGQEPATTVVASTVAPVSVAPGNGSSATPALRHKVTRGDTLTGIAARYSVAKADLLKLNQLQDANQIRLGQSLLIRAAGDVADNDDEPEEMPAAVVASAQTEPKTESEAEETGPTLLAGVQGAGSADPADYAVRSNKTIRVEAAETLGHYADWLNTTPARLRTLNKLSASSTVQLGKTLKLDFARATIKQFEARRVVYHQQLQDAFFAEFRIVGSDTHVLKKGESIWLLSQKAYNVPVWLLRQYNPEVDLNDVRPGVKLVIPRVKLIEG